jgi:zinc carboxypeptidase
MTRRGSWLGVALAIVAVAAAHHRASAQRSSERSAQDLASAKPGRDPGQPIDADYTKRILEDTTEKFFLSPLVDYLPASKTVPTPKAVLGDIAGATGNLPYSKQVHEYMRLLAKAAPGRVKVFGIGTTEEGREMIAVAVGSESIISRIDENKARLAKLADPRTIKMDDSEAARIVPETVPVYYITGTIHSPEAGAPTALMEMAYRLVVDDSAYIKNIRDNVLTVITPVVEVDGRDRMVDLYNWSKKYPKRQAPPLLYWGKYVAHDNNRDAMAVTLKLTENVLNTMIDWHATVMHDLHESAPYLYDNTVLAGAYNAWIDPLLTNEWHMIGWNNVQEMTRMGMPGVYAVGTWDNWSPGYLFFLAATHNGICRLYETFGNGGTADTRERILGPDQTSRTWYRQNPPLPRVMWSLRNHNNYIQTGLLVSLSYVANNRRQLIDNFYQKSKRSILKARTEGPAAWVMSTDEPSLGRQADLLRVLQKQHVEISRATKTFSVKMPKTSPREFPAGSYIIRMDQPYSRAADVILDYQYWSPNETVTPYDDTGWTFPEGYGVQAVRVTDVSVLDVPTERVTGTVRAPGAVIGTGAMFAINNTADNELATLRYRLKDADIQAVEDPFEADGRRFNRGTFLVRNVPLATLEATTKELGLRAYGLTAAPAVKVHPVRAARVAIIHTWTSTQAEGWWRLAFDQLAIPYDYISPQDIAKTPDLKARWDVVIFPPSSGSALSLIEGLPMWGADPVPWKVSPDTPNLGTLAETDDIRPGMTWQGLIALQNFVKDGGVFLAATSSTELPMSYGLSRGVITNPVPSNTTVRNSLLRTRLSDATSPIAYGVADNLAIFTNDGQSFTVTIDERGRGRGTGGRGMPPIRTTGTGRADDAEVIQGRPIYQPTLPPEGGGSDQGRPNAPLVPADQRPRTILRFAAQPQLLVSGLLNGGGDIADRANLVHVPIDKGHVVLFSFNPMYRAGTVGSYAFVLNTILHFDSLNAGRSSGSR